MCLAQGSSLEKWTRQSSVRLMNRHNSSPLKNDAFLDVLQSAQAKSQQSRGLTLIVQNTVAFVDCQALCSNLLRLRSDAVQCGGRTSQLQRKHIQLTSDHPRHRTCVVSDPVDFQYTTIILETLPCRGYFNLQPRLLVGSYCRCKAAFRYPWNV